MNVKEHILAAIRECLAKNLPASGKAILFGSQARGTAREDSDWDILIILDKEKLMADDYDNITYPLTELGWELGEEINPVMYTAQEWEKYRNTPFGRNVGGSHRVRIRPSIIAEYAPYIIDFQLCTNLVGKDGSFG